MLIRKMTDADWPGAGQVYLEGIRSGIATVVRELPSYEDWDREHDPNFRFVAEDTDAGMIAGFISVHRRSMDGAGLISVYVADNYKKQGIGKLLMQNAQEECADAGCSVLESWIFEENIPSIRLHQKTGFVFNGITHRGSDSRPVHIYIWEAKTLLLRKLFEAVVDMDDIEAKEVARKVVDIGVDAWEAIEKGLVYAMERAGDLFEREEYFIPELLMCSDAMNAAMAVLKPQVKKTHSSKGRIVIGTISGDTHDIGKNIVALILESAGFDVLDLGRDVSARRFVDEAIGFHADIIALSSLMTTTMENMAEVAALLIRENLRNDFILMVGGRPLSKAFAKRIGADVYAKNAADALRAVKRIMKEKQNQK